MKQGIVLLGHGSKLAKGNDELVSMVSLVDEIVDNKIVDYGFLEHAEPDIPAGIVAAVNAGADEVKCVPMLLFAAGHMKRDFPEHLEIARKRCPNAKISLTKHLGVDKKIIEIIKDRVFEVSPSMGEGEAVLLVGRGSLDEEANANSADVVRELIKALKTVNSSVSPIVEFCFLGLAKPDIPAGIEACIKRGAKTVNIVPYFLFDGVLIDRIKSRVDEYAKKYQATLRLGSYIGVDKLLAELIIERAGD